MDRTLAGSLGLKGDWDLGEDGWKDNMDSNLLKLSVLVQARVLDLVSVTPGAPTEGQVFVFSAGHATQPNKIAAYDEGGWKYITPLPGWMVYNVTEDEYLKFFDDEWTLYATGSDGISDAPEDGQNYVRKDGAWVIAPEGGGSGSYRGTWGDLSAYDTFEDDVVDSEGRYDQTGGTYGDNVPTVEAEADTDAGLTKALRFSTLPTGLGVSGYWSMSFDVNPTVDDDTFKMRLKHDAPDSGGDHAYVHVLIDGVLDQAFDCSVSNGVWLDYEQVLDPGAHDIEIRFGRDYNNVGGSKSLWLSRISIPGDGGEGYNYSDTVTQAGMNWFCRTAGTTEEPGDGVDWIPFIPEAPIDGSEYVRKDGDWAVATGGGGGGGTGVAAAWVQFNGTGTVAINGSDNVSSITDNGTGDYTVNFASTLAHANYAVAGMGSAGGSDEGVPSIQKDSPTRTTSAVRIYNVRHAVYTVQDASDISVIIIM